MSFEALQQIAHPEKAHVLVHLADHEGDAPGQLSDHLERPLSTIYRYLAGLESAGLVYAKEDGGIKRYHLVPFRFLIEPEGLREMTQSPLDLATAYRKLLGKRQPVPIDGDARGLPGSSRDGRRHASLERTRDHHLNVST